MENLGKTYPKISSNRLEGYLEYTCNKNQLNSISYKHSFLLPDPNYPYTTCTGSWDLACSDRIY
jgi:hypothetical protein